MLVRVIAHGIPGHQPTELDESYRKAHKGWYPIDMI